MAPGDSFDAQRMVDFALSLDVPTSIRYPKANTETLPGERQPIELGKAEILRWGRDGVILACGTLVNESLRAADRLRQDGLDVGVVNARFIKPIDREVIERALRDGQFIVAVEEGCLMGGFGSAVLEAAADMGLDCSRIKRLGIPDRFVEHGERAELLGDLGLDQPGIMAACRAMAERTPSASGMQTNSSLP
jgi:1-deoxy-D-xylulose-5-phosphate synthase